MGIPLLPKFQLTREHLAHCSSLPACGGLFCFEHTSKLTSHSGSAPSLLPTRNSLRCLSLATPFFHLSAWMLQCLLAMTQCTVPRYHKQHCQTQPMHLFPCIHQIHVKVSEKNCWAKKFAFRIDEFRQSLSKRSVIYVCNLDILRGFLLYMFQIHFYIFSPVNGLIH